MQTNDRTVLVTGSSGTVGTALVHRLLAEGYEVYGTDIVANPWSELVNERLVRTDLRSTEGFEELPSDIDTIVHLAAHARVHKLVQEPEKAMENVEMTFNVLQFARKHDVSQVIFASSREVYGNADQVIYKETATYTDSSESPYTASKVSGESMVEAFGSCYDLSTCIVRLSNVYGRYDRSDRVIPLFIAESTHGRDLTVFGSEKVLDFTYLDDCVDGLYQVIKQFPKVRQTTINIAAGRGYSLVELAEMINERTPSKSDIIVEPSRTGEVSRYVADISRAESILGYRPQYSLGEGISETIDWYEDHPDLLENLRTDASATLDA